VFLGARIHIAGLQGLRQLAMRLQSGLFADPRIAWVSSKRAHK
jgi:hypothetical protein